MADSKEIDGGGFAFPWSVKIESGSFNPIRSRVVPKGEADCEVFTGMTMRDYFAGQAISALIEGFCNKHFSTEVHKPETLIAAKAYELADAMIAARKARA